MIRIKSGKQRALLSAFICVLCAFAFLCIAAARVGAYDKIYPNISVEKIDVGGLSEEEAVQRLNSEYMSKLENKSFKLILADDKGKPVAPERTAEVGINDINAEPEIENTVRMAFRHNRDKGFFGKLFAYHSAKRKPYEIKMQGQISGEKTDTVVTALADGFETPVREVSYSLDGNVLTIVNGHGGERVDRKKAETAISEAVFSLSDEAVVLSVGKAEPEEVNLDEFYDSITSAQKDAYYDRRDGEIVIIDDFPKIELNKSELKKALASGDEEYKINVKTVPASVTAAELKAKLFRDNMGSWTSKFSASNVPRSSNVRLTASRINGVTLLPGEVFSYDKTIGSRTAANGYKTAGVYIGNKVEEGIGGGICQTSSTLYSAVLYANLEIVSRTSHSLPVSYMPPGQDATIAEGYIDFKFKNNTSYPVKIVCTSTASTVTCSILGVKPDGERVEIINTKTADNLPKTVREYDENIPVGYKKITQKGAAGYNISSVRIVKKNGVEAKREKLTNSVYKATDTIEAVNPADRDVPSENLAVYSGQTAVKAEEPTTNEVAGGEDKKAEAAEKKAESQQAIGTDESNGSKPEAEAETVETIAVQ